MARKNDKKERLIDAASQLFYQKGVSTTTLANIAELADVPLGNVYYYFKSKDSIILAVIEKRREMLKKMFNELDQVLSPKDRLQALVNKSSEEAQTTANYGDFLGGLCQELGKQGGNIAEAAASLMQEILKWCEVQFKKMGKTDDASAHAANFVSALQGLNLLTLTFKDPGYIAKQGKFLVDSIETK